MNALSVRSLRVIAQDSGVEVVRTVDLDVEAGEILGLVGESGSGKTTLGLAVLGYARRGLRIASGRVSVGNADVLRLSARKLQAFRGSTVSYVPQDPSAALNPALTIGRHLSETLDAHAYGANAEERAERRHETLRDVLLPGDAAFLRRYPHQLSGGQQQRVVLAIAFACRPAVVILDEPTTGLDVTTQAHVLATVRDMSKSYGTAAIYVTHDLAVVASLADRIAVMYAGSIIEEGTTPEIFGTPGHPYTARLLAAIPHLDGRVATKGIPGRAPSLRSRPHGCAFEPRCNIAEAACAVALPDPYEVSPRHYVRCIRTDKVAYRPSDATHAALPAKSTAAQVPLLEIKRLDAWYRDTDVLHDVDFSIEAGECVALVGESGSGKTTLARIVAGLHHEYRGEVLLDGAPLGRSARERPSEVRRRVQYVFQNPYSSLNPRRAAGESISRPLMLTGASRSAARARVKEILDLVSIAPDYAYRYPDQMSGGERQRIAIARALIADPDLLICDEVTSALDVSVQATILELLTGLQRELNLSLLFVTHNLPLVGSIASRAAVMRRGVIVETGAAAALLADPQHEYTQKLIRNTPSLRTR